MAGVSRCIMLLANPLYSLFHPVRPSPSLLHLTRHAHPFPSSLSHIHHHHHELHLNTLSFTSLQHPLKLLPSIPKSSRSHLHIQSQLTVPNDAHSSSSQYRWPEFCKLLDVIPRRQHSPAVANYDISPDDAFLTDEDFPHEFLSAARDCLTFSHSQPDLLGSLSRRDLEVVVENGTPFLFKSELDSARRMRAFLGIGGSTVSESNRAHTVDLMKYLLSYASNPTISSQPNNLCSTGPLISSCRNLLNELTEMSYRLSRSGLSAPHQYQFPSRFEQPPRLYGRKIEMKRGDWICRKCSFMNFARNVKCPKCEEPRPQRQLTGGEWECPQCDFFNYGRNMVCLRCDCKRPGETSFSTISSSLGLVNSNMDYENKTDVDRGLAANEEKPQLWFSKISQLSNASDLSSAADDEDFPEILPLRKGVNRSVVSTRKTPLERKLTNSQHRRNMSNDVSQEDNYSVTWGASKCVDSPVNQRPNQLLVERSSTSKADSCRVSSGQNVGTGSSMMPSVSDSPQYEQQEGDDSNCSSVADEPKKSGEHILFSEKTEMQTGSLYKERERAEKSDRWFKRVAELHGIEDLTSEISDVDFPEIMPIRKGENRFVVSKKKDRSLTSPMYKRQVAVEQANSGNHVPFVPFPPGYFAKKDKQQVEDTDSTVQSTTESISSLKKEGLNNMICAERVENQPTKTVKWNSNSFGSSRLPMNGDSVKNSSNSQTITEEAQVSGYSEKVNSPETSMSGGSSQLPQNQNVSSWTGKSLEGSAVKEPDPLDMSEEAKAERWFRRVAQIKDISELSQIPDEDFPSIMPMRKGVNRFVVSKRKTPLERRLTSPQYRRNLPIESCDPAKKETDSS